MPGKQVIRRYKGTDAQMLLAADVLVNAAIDHEAALAAERPLWTAAYYQSVKARINAVAREYLGATGIAGLKHAGNTVTRLGAAARKDLALLKLQIMTDFRKEPARRDELLSLLGYDHTYTAVTGKDQEALTAMLFTVAAGLTPEIEQALLAKGAGPALLTRLKTAAGPFHEANTRQEGIKGSNPEATRKAILAFNDLYEEVIGIAKIAAKLFMENKALSNRFNYSHIIKAMGSSHNGSSDEEEDATEGKE